MSSDNIPDSNYVNSEDTSEPKNNPHESTGSIQSCESMNDQSTFFHVLDYVEEPYDENEEYSSDDDESHVSTKPNDENKGFKFEFETDQILDAIEGDSSNYDECYVIDKPTDLNENPLPAGWKEVYHESGALLYWHPETNVCSLSRPYFLGAGSTKTHRLPETAIPCLYYRDPSTRPERSESSQENIIKYGERLFKFKKIKYLKFRSWDVRRTYLRTLRNERNRRRCPFSNNKFIAFPIVKKDEEGNVVSSKKWIVTPRGKSYVAILHEYLQQSLKTQPFYTFKEVDNAKTPYAATVVVNGDEYGTGVGMSKKEAKVEAAKATLLVLLPKMKKDILNNDEKHSKRENDSGDEDLNVVSIFDDIEITDSRVTKLSKRTTEPLPYELLLKCLQKKNDSQEVKFDFKVESAECTMSVGEHTVTVQCDNKRDGKQEAAQALLKVLHPYINNWGSLLRLYSNNTNDHYQLGSRQVTEEKDPDELRYRSPNKKLLTTLQSRMKQLSELNKNT